MDGVSNQQLAEVARGAAQDLAEFGHCKGELFERRTVGAAEESAACLYGALVRRLLLDVYEVPAEGDWTSCSSTMRAEPELERINEVMLPTLVEFPSSVQARLTYPQLDPDDLPELFSGWAMRWNDDDAEATEVQKLLLLTADRLEVL